MEDFPETLREYSPVEILNIAYEARDLKGIGLNTEAEKLAEMRRRHSDFWFRYPRLLEICCQPNPDMEQLSFMLNMLSAVNKKKTTLEAADKQVHERLADKFNVPEPTPPTPQDQETARSQ